MTRIPPILIVTAAATLAALSLLSVRFSTSLFELLPADLPEVRGMEQLNRFFSRDGQLIVTMHSEAAWATEDGAASLADRLRQEPALVSGVHRELSVEELVTEGGSLVAWMWLNAPPGELRDLAQRLRPGPSGETIRASLAAARDAFAGREAFVAGYDPLELTRRAAAASGDGSRPDTLRSADGTFEILHVAGHGVDFSDYRAVHDWLEQVREVVDAWCAGFNASLSGEATVTTGLTGTPAFMGEIGTEIERDMTVSVLLTIVLVSILFYLLHRQLRPLSWLVAGVLVTLALTILVARAVFGDLNVMSAGFAAILLGLAIDYGIVLYREAMTTGSDVRCLRRAVGPGIMWAAVTTAVVFLSLNFSSLPGLAEMGNLVAAGVVIGAAVMLLLFAPVAVSFTARQKKAASLLSTDTPKRWTIVPAVLVPLAAAGSLWLGGAPGLTPDFHPFRIREGPSMLAWQQLQLKLRGPDHAVPAIITGRTLEELNNHLEAAGHRIARARRDGLVVDAIHPSDLIPHPEHQRENAATLHSLLDARGRLLAEIDAAGFSEDGASLTGSVFDAWSHYLAGLDRGAVSAPTGALATWTVDRLYRREDGTHAALVAVRPATAADRRWVTAICDEHTTVASLGSLGTALNGRIRGDLVRVFLPMLGLLVVMLAIVFRSWRDLLLSLLCLLFSGSLLLLLTLWTPLAWNSFNVCGLPLIFGTGLDFSIHMIFALRRGGGSAAIAREGIGKALVFCGASTAIGFGSLASSSAHGLSSLGIVCAIGVLINMAVAVILLPWWYGVAHRDQVRI